MWEGGNVGGEGAFPSYISMSNIEHFDATSKSSMPRRRVRRHVEQFDATSNSSMPRREIRCPTSINSTPHTKQLDAKHQTTRRHVIVWRFHGRSSPPSYGVIIPLYQKWRTRGVRGDVEPQPRLSNFPFAGYDRPLEIESFQIILGSCRSSFQTVSNRFKPFQTVSNRFKPFQIGTSHALAMHSRTHRALPRTAERPQGNPQRIVTEQRI